MTTSLADHPKTGTYPRDSVGRVTPRTVRLFAPPDGLRLACGRSLGPIDVAYETYGKLSPARDNAIFVCHALTGDAHAAGYHTTHDRRPGWWDMMIGPGKAIDTERYFVICANVLGGCRGTTGPSSINPATGQRWGLDFPVVTIGDMVAVHRRLVAHLGIERLLAVVGGSMGGMQVLDWAVRYPESVAAAIAIATTPRLSAQSIAFDAIGRTAILNDARFDAGNYAEGDGPALGLAIARMIGHITYLSEAGMHEKFGRQLRHADRYRYDFSDEFSVETYLNHQGRTFVERFDANSYLYVTKAMDYFDLAAQGESLAEVLAKVRARTLVVSFTSDWLFTPEQSRQIVDAMLANNQRVTYCDIDSPFGHDAFLLEPERLGRLIGGHLQGTLHRERGGRSGIRVNDAPIAEAEIIEAPAQPIEATRSRPDLACIAEWIEPGARVLDLGCGNGDLLYRLWADKRVQGLGVEHDADSVLASADLGIAVIHGDLERELAKFPDGSFDVVVLSQTLQALDQPARVIHEMLRVGRTGLLSFTNAAHWRRRIALAGGRVTGRGAAGCWNDAPRERALSLRDFLAGCRGTGIAVERVAALSSRGRRVARWGANWRAGQAVVRLRGQE
jgi:homoserine O-acetyltransferase